MIEEKIKTHLFYIQKENKYMISQGILFAHMMMMMISFQQGRENRADIHKR